MPTASDDEIARLRKQIDGLDTRLCDLLAERFAVARSLADLKTQGLPMFRPQREQAILERLQAQGKDRIPREVIVGVWRLLMTSAAFQQMPFSIAYARGDALGNACRGAHFSAQIPQRAEDKPRDAIALCAQDPSVFALLSVQQPGAAATELPWWRFLSGSHAPRIVQSLPLAARLSGRAQARVFLLGRVPSNFFDERAAVKYFLLTTTRTPMRLAQTLSLAQESVSVLGVSDDRVLLECREVQNHSAQAIVETLQHEEEEAAVRHLGSAYEIPFS